MVVQAALAWTRTVRDWLRLHLYPRYRRRGSWSFPDLEVSERVRQVVEGITQIDELGEKSLE